jgi:hypothetical protein
LADDLARAREAAATMLGAPVEVAPVRGGRNSRIFHVRSRDGEFALKHYPAGDDPRDRLGTEVGALRLMERHGIVDVPRVKAVDRERGCVLLGWIEGAPVDRVTDADIDSGLAFLSAVHALRRRDGAAEQPLASEACLSGAEIERQIAARLARLRAAGAAELVEFIEHDVAPAFVRARAQARETLASRLDFAAELPHEWQSLVPSDFGYHNSLRRPDGSLAFVDFEYFGWDDPVKLTADILLHPGRPLGQPQRRRFRAAAQRLYGDPLFAPRLTAWLPLFGLRWVLILLNEFVPAVWQRRVRAGADQSWDNVKAQQLGAARRFLAGLPQRVEA